MLIIFKMKNKLSILIIKQKVKKIASFIAEINDKDEIGKDSFTKLLNNLVSYQLDADRIDYLLRDSHYVGIACAIDLTNQFVKVEVISVKESTLIARLK